MAAAAALSIATVLVAEQNIKKKEKFPSPTKFSGDDNRVGSRTDFLNFFIKFAFPVGYARNNNIGGTIDSIAPATVSRGTYRNYRYSA